MIVTPGFICFYWSIIDLQYFVHFRCTAAFKTPNWLPVLQLKIPKLLAQTPEIFWYPLNTENEHDEKTLKKFQILYLWKSQYIFKES